MLAQVSFITVQFQVSTVSRFNEAMMRLFEMLPLLSGLMDKEEQDSFTKCIPKITNFVCHTALPRDAKCEPLKPCKEMCDDVFNGCVSRRAVASIRKILNGGSYRSLVLSTFVASESAVVNAFDGFIKCCLPQTVHKRFTRTPRKQKSSAYLLPTLAEPAKPANQYGLLRELRQDSPQHGFSAQSCPTR